MLHLLDLPTELILHFLNALDFRSLLRCRQLNKAFKETIDSDVVSQYTIELAIDGMEDGPSSGISPSERLELLRGHRAAWKSMKFTSQIDIPMSVGGVWELYGGVLAQGLSNRGLSFTLLPSELRGIKQRSWTLDDLGVKIRDFGMDPSQDLLVIVVKPPRGSTEYSVHLRTLSTGRAHPNASSPAVLRHNAAERNFTFAIQISGKHLGILFQSGDESDSELVIWNWQTGAIEMSLSFDTQSPFAFLSERHVLVTYVRAEDEGNPELVLSVFDFLSAPSKKKSSQEMESVCDLMFPALDDAAEILAVSLRSDPAPGWKPHLALAAPFYKDRNERLFVLTIWFAEHGQIKPLLLFLPSSTALRHVEKCESDVSNQGRHIPWIEWGPSGARLWPAPTIHSPVWVCYVYGMSFICVKMARPGRRRMLQLFDFNQLAVKKRLGEQGTDKQDPSDILMDRETSTGTAAGVGIFEGTVTTSLPFQMRTFAAGHEDKLGASMMSEDAIITVYNAETLRYYRVFNF